MGRSLLGAGQRSVLAVFVTPCVAAVAFLGWRATLVRHVGEQEALMRAIAQHGGNFSLDSEFLDRPAYGPPEWLQALLGERYFSNIVSINLGATAITDESVEKLARLRHLQSLGIWRTRTSDAALAAVARLAELETLDISQTDVTDDGLARLAGLENIRVLVVGGDRITDQGLAHLGRMSGLTMLCVVGNQFSPPAKKDLERSLPDTTSSSPYRRSLRERRGRRTRVRRASRNPPRLTILRAGESSPRPEASSPDPIYSPVRPFD